MNYNVVNMENKAKASHSGPDCGSQLLPVYAMRP